MAKLIKKLNGHSLSEILLLQNERGLFVRKSGNVQRNLERYDILSGLNISVPKIYEVYGDSYDMEYIFGLDIKKYLSINPVENLIQFLEDTLGILTQNTFEKDFRPIYESKLNDFNFSRFKLPFTAKELIEKLPHVLPCSEYHGDFTLDNILFNAKTDSFILIDPLTTEYNSYVFDLAKLRQDLVCKWFMRDGNLYYIEPKLKSISDRLQKYQYFDNDYLLILMLMRILPYTTKIKDEKFLIEEIKKLWK